MAFTILPPEPVVEDPAMMDAVDQGIVAADTEAMDEVERKKRESEEKTVKKLFEEYTQSRKFDEPIRKQYAVDRRYAAGTVDLTWAVTANLIGSFIDILVSFLYARNPDVTVKKAPQVDNRGSKDMDAFAKTMELVISRLWKKGALKKVARRQVRSGLTVGEGWFKAVLICDAPENPEMKNDLNDLRDNIARLEAVKAALAATEQDGATEDTDTQIAKQNELMDSLENKIEATIRKYMAIDFVPAQNIQTSLDVACTEDYLDANWNADSIYILREEVKQKFPRLTDEEVKTATTYYQRQVKDLAPLGEGANLQEVGGGGVSADDAEYYTTGTANSGQQGSGDNGPEFIKAIELWDRRTNHIKTMIEGVKRWAKEPFQPPYASSRFYPYFRLAFYEVDGARHPQSLSWRLAKLQDEYASSRSNFRLTRERAIPGTIFNKTGMSPEDVNGIVNGTQQEFIGITPTDPNTPIQNLFAAKPVEKIDPRMFDDQKIFMDMEKISGVQEALQSSQTTGDKTAKQISVEQSGFASRTTADRDFLEDMLTDFANYTGEVALGALNTRDAQRIAGPAAFWPEGMDLDDRLTLIEIDIEAGSTGKPGEEGDQQAWGVILPVLKEAILTISQAVQAGDIPLAKVLSELVRETMAIMGITTDPERFLPPIPEMPDPLIQAVTGGVPGVPGSVAPAGGAPSLPPSAGPAGGGPLSNPSLAAPNLSPPVL